MKRVRVQFDWNDQWLSALDIDLDTSIQITDFAREAVIQDLGEMIAVILELPGPPKKLSEDVM